MMSSADQIIGPVNLGNSVEFSMLELAESIIRLTKSKSNIVNCELPTDDPKQRQPDISRAKSELQWEPRVPLEDGLRRTIEYFRTML